MTTTAAVLIQAMGLAPHPEGGHYRETYRSTQRVMRPDGASRHAGTAIYFLLATGEYSAWHRIASDEIWHFHAGSPLRIHVLHKGKLATLHLGHPVELPGAQFQHVVPAGAWFAAEPMPARNEREGYSLVGCTVAPGFEFSEFELATPEALALAGAPDTETVRRLLPQSVR
ncbi:cupin domain-containing protein [Pusillimonas sp. CC-YST705]|uniref:Cupin domain-containing protein n=1 Tax=Mesopusillimonas faecipullorum TaxID=2755040 RepID=A0ABS8CDC1_9BURK|nr:cupin domain-containing protein [Mesopusillimonas faecipullorum]MCB5363814.1 cupin domain-containing protein [Mesopusillimonas faecipullorum]